MVLSLLFTYIFTIILFVGSIVVVVNVKSVVTSTGIVEVTHPISEVPEDKIGPIGVPVESANCIVA